MYDAKLRERFWSKVDILENTFACWLWTAARRPLGYGAFNVGHINGKKRTLIASRVAYELATGEAIPPGLHVLHACDNPPCVNPGHLFLGTDADNIHDCMAKGRFRPQPHYGNDNAAAKTTPAAVREMRSLYASGVKVRELVRLYGLSQPTINRIIARRNWKHVA